MKEWIKRISCGMGVMFILLMMGCTHSQKNEQIGSGSSLETEGEVSAVEEEGEIVDDGVELFQGVYKEVGAETVTQYVLMKNTHELLTNDTGLLVHSALRHEKAHKRIGQTEQIDFIESGTTTYQFPNAENLTSFEKKEAGKIERIQDGVSGYAWWNTCIYADGEYEYKSETEIDEQGTPLAPSEKTKCSIDDTHRESDEEWFDNAFEGVMGWNVLAAKPLLADWEVHSLQQLFHTDSEGYFDCETYPSGNQERNKLEQGDLSAYKVKIDNKDTQYTKIKVTVSVENLCWTTWTCKAGGSWESGRFDKGEKYIVDNIHSELFFVYTKTGKLIACQAKQSITNWTEYWGYIESTNSYRDENYHTISVESYIVPWSGELTPPANLEEYVQE